MIRPVQKDLFAVIGNPVSHSLSPAMIGAAFRALNIPAVYVALEVEDLASDLETLTKMGFRGLSVTIPHKEEAFRLADDVDETARTIGAVNTLRRRKDRWEGRNTDWLGSNRALKQVTDLAGKRALVIGAGGAARAVVFGLIREGSQVLVSNRNIARGTELASAFGCDFIPLAELDRNRDFESIDIVVQCTSVGLAGKQARLPVSNSFFHPGMIVMDTVYRPLWTPFMQAARAAGSLVVSGLDMLLYQGVAQLEWWLESAIPSREGIQVMRETLIEALTNEQDDKEC